MELKTASPLTRPSPGAPFARFARRNYIFRERAGERARACEHTRARADMQYCQSKRVPRCSSFACRVDGRRTPSVDDERCHRSRTFSSSMTIECHCQNPQDCIRRNKQVESKRRARPPHFSWPVHSLRLISPRARAPFSHHALYTPPFLSPSTYTRYTYSVVAFSPLSLALSFSPLSLYLSLSLYPLLFRGSRAVLPSRAPDFPSAARGDPVDGSFALAPRRQKLTESRFEVDS